MRSGDKNSFESPEEINLRPVPGADFIRRVEFLIVN
jgi:hypothetical protein